MPGGPCCSPLLKAHPMVPRGRGERGRGEKVKLKAPGTVKKHTSLCFPLSTWWSIILTTRWRKERTCLFFYTTFFGVMEVNSSHKTLSNIALPISLNTSGLTGGHLHSHFFCVQSHSAFIAGMSDIVHVSVRNNYFVNKNWENQKKPSLNVTT